MTSAQLPGIAAFSDASFPLNPSSTTPARYQTGDPVSLVAGHPFSIAVVNTPINGDVLFIPDSVGGGNVGIVTHAGTFGSEAGMNFEDLAAQTTRNALAAYHIDSALTP